MYGKSKKSASKKVIRRVTIPRRFPRLEPNRNQVMPVPSSKVETKWADYTASGTIANGTVPSLVSGVTTGPGNNGHVGQKLTYVSITSRFYASLTAANSFAAIRTMLVYDRSPNGVLPALTDILVANTSTTTVDVTSLQNMLNRDRFWVIADEQYQLGITGPQSACWKMHRKLNTDQTFVGTDATIASIGSGAIYLVTIPDHQSGAVPWVTLSAFVRIKFTDS